ncbi:tetratricopeptide repeat protein [Leptolyngbya sp. PL-A3]
MKEKVFELLQRSLQEQRYPRAIALVEGLAQRLPQDAEVRQWLAVVYQRWGRHLISTRQFDKAKIFLNKALRTDPHNRTLWYEVDRDMRRIDGIEIM